MTEPINLSEIIKEGQRIKEDTQQSRTRFAQSQRESWRQLVGERLDEMLANCQSAMNCLEDLNGTVRAVALEILLEVWKTQTSSEFRQQCEKMALADSDIEARSMAVIALGSCYSSTNDVAIGTLLAKLITDESLALPIRESAYHSLFTLSGRTEAWVDLNMYGYKFPVDVDWNFVNRYL
jgi:hypothetical protein